MFVPIINPCCCVVPSCLLGSDNFNRSDNSDVNVGAPFTYDINSGSFAIVSSNMESTASTAEFSIPVFGPEPTHARNYLIQWACNSTSAVLTVTIGNHEVTIDLAAGSMRVYDTVFGDYIWSRETVAYTANTTVTMTVQHGAIHHDTPSGRRFLQYGLKIQTLGSVAFTVPLPTVELSSDATLYFEKVGSATLKVLLVSVYQSEPVGTYSLASACLSSTTGTNCINGTNNFTKTLEWAFPSGSWSGLTCSSPGKAQFIGGYGLHNKVVASFAIPTKGRTMFGDTDDIYYLPVVGDYHAFWLDDQMTGYRITNNALGVEQDEYLIEVIVDGTVVQSSLTPTTGISLVNNVSLRHVNGQLAVHTGTTSSLQTVSKAYTWTNPPDVFVPTLEDGSSGANRAYGFSSQSAMWVGPFLPCTRWTNWLGNTGTDGCTSPGSGFDIALANVGGTCGDASSAATNVNATYRVTSLNDFISSGVEVCGVKAFCCVAFGSDWKYSTTGGSTAPPARRLAVHVQLDNAWALFEYDVAAVPACSTLSSTSFSLVDYHNAGDIDFASATCAVSYVA